MSENSIDSAIRLEGGYAIEKGHTTEYEHVSEHPMHWETSPWPLLLCVGLLFLIPFAFALYFVYAMPSMAVLSLGIGAPLTVLSIAGWIKEGLSQKEEPGYVLTAMPIFIVAEAFIFVAFFAGYWLTRLTSLSWPPAGTPEISATLPVIMTIILVASSITMHFSEEKIERGDRVGFLGWLIATIILGCVFFGLSMNEWSHLFAEGFNFKTNIFSTAFFSITGFHASHVIVGLGMFVCILIPALMGKTSKNFVKAASMYWHFVDIVWFFVVTQVYFWS